MPTRSTYADRLRDHLASYKRASLAVSDDGVWSRNGRPYPHILPRDRLELNFLPALREPIREYLSQHPDVRLHRDAHHLNSSQVMCMNLMFPAILSQRVRQAVLAAAGLREQVNITACHFECVPDSVEGTNFDFVSDCSDGRRLFWEFKLTESEFGVSADDETHRVKLAEIYLPRLCDRVPASLLEPSYFFTHYQLLRNLSHLRAGDVLLFALPSANRSLMRQAEVFVKALAPEIQFQIRIVAMEELASSFAESVRDDALLTRHFQEFADKYLITR